MYNMEIQTEPAEKRELGVANINNNYINYTSQVAHDCDGKYAPIQPTLTTDTIGTQPRARPAQKKSKKLKRYRRPMNDFLMFCKRHRRRVRQVYSTKENRFITKKLGLLWSHLSDEEKHPYKMLSDKHKEIYLTAFPDYQWTKNSKVVPETVSTAATVPTGEDGINTPSTDGENSPEETMHNDERVAAQALLAISTGVGLPPMTTFKLADVNQMGNLSTLIAGSGDHSVGTTIRSDNGLEHNYSASNDTVATLEEEPYRNMPHFLENMRPKSNQATMSTFSVPPAVFVGAVEAQANNTPSAVPGRADRSCKGKRYKEFMEQQQLARHSHGTATSSNPRKQTQKRSVAPTATVTSASATVPDLAATHVPPTSSIRIEGGATSNRVPDDEANAALHKELNAEIEQLPLYDILEILDRQNKRRKKPYAISSKAGKKRKVTSPKSCISMPPPETITSASISSPSPPPPAVHPIIASSSPVELPTPPVIPISSAPALPPTAPPKIVGCRKRKAPKECITRYTVL